METAGCHGSQAIRFGKREVVVPLVGFVRRVLATHQAVVVNKKSHGGVDEAETRLHWVDKWLGTRANKGRLLFQKSGFGGTREHGGSEKKMQSQMMMIKMRSFSLLHKLAIGRSRKEGGPRPLVKDTAESSVKDSGRQSPPDHRGERVKDGRGERGIFGDAGTCIRHGPWVFSVRVKAQVSTERR